MHSLLISLKRRQTLLVCLRPEVVVPLPKERKTDHPKMVSGTRVFVHSTKIFRFAAGEQAPRPLSLKCEPNSRLWRELGEKPRFCRQRKEKQTIRRWSVFFGSGTRIRTQTYRVRVCCATFTQFRYTHFRGADYILPQGNSFVNRFL